MLETRVVPGRRGVECSRRSARRRLRGISKPCVSRRQLLPGSDVGDHDGGRPGANREDHPRGRISRPRHLDGRDVRLSASLEPSRKRLVGGVRQIRVGARHLGDDPPASQAHAFSRPLRPRRAVPAGGPDRRLERSRLFRPGARTLDGSLRTMAGRSLSRAPRPPLSRAPFSVSLESASHGQALTSGRAGGGGQGRTA